MKTTKLFRWLPALVSALAVSPLHAADWHPDGVAVQVGAGTRGSAMAGVGVIWDWDFERMRRKSELTAHTELMLNHWRADAIGGGSQALTQVVVLPSLRMRLAQGRSPWFLELGIGASWMDRLLLTPEMNFSTQWNFYDMLGGGYSFGSGREHEVGMRWVHVSNAGLKKPNPGQDFLQLRYVLRF